MAEDSLKIEQNKQWNERFLRAFDYVCAMKRINQTMLAKEMRTNGPLISDYRSGKKRASEDMFRRLVVASDNKIYSRYLTGKSEYMLLSNVPDLQIIEDERRESNPDYDIMNSVEQVSEPISIYKPEHNPDQIPKWADTFIDLLTEQVKQNEALNRDLRAAISEVNELKNELSILINKLSRK